jgi:hypothetical protein
VKSGRPEDARRHYDEALQVSTETGYERMHAVSLGGLGMVHVMSGNLVEGRAMHELSLMKARDVDSTQVAWELCQLARVARLEGDCSQACEHQLECLQIRGKSGDRIGIAQCLDETAHLAACLGDHAEAARFLGAAARVREMIKSPLAPGELADVNRSSDACRAATGDGAFDYGRAVGAALVADDGSCAAAVDASLAWLKRAASRAIRAADTGGNGNARPDSGTSGAGAGAAAAAAAAAGETSFGPTPAGAET